MHTVCSHRPAFFFFLMIRRPPRSTRTDTLFPTRRSSDLSLRDRGSRHRRSMPRRSSTDRAGGSRRERCSSCAAHRGRSEEHTSELQSLMRISYAVFCLNKKRIKISNNTDSYASYKHNQVRSNRYDQLITSDVIHQT